MLALRVLKLKEASKQKMKATKQQLSGEDEGSHSHQKVDTQAMLQKTLSIAYYNLAVEYEHVQEPELAIQSFSKSRYFASFGQDQSSFIQQI